jgi:hypothetical protein
MMATERQIQIAFTSFMSSWYPNVIYYHVPNEKAKTIVPEGVKKGVADCIIDEPMGIYSGLRLELKTEKGTLTSHQKKFGEMWISKGYHWEVCYGLEQAKDAVKRYMSL